MGKNMLSFGTFLIEATQNEDKLKHLEHAEDWPINAGEEGFNHAFKTLHATHQMLQGHEVKGASLSTKYDGSPSIVFGHHPETGKFFVASKSVFNKDPKLNYTHEDIQNNHGHAEGLVSKLKSALEHLPKVTPKKGVFQGDFMYSKKDSDVAKDEKGNLSFKPNTVRYSAKKGSEESAKAAKAHIGVAIHTAYHGDKLEDMKAEYNADLSKFKEHPDTHIINTKFDPKSATYSKDEQNKFESHMQKALVVNQKLNGNHSHTDNHVEHLKTYINSTVKDSLTPTVSGYKTHLRTKLQKEVDKVKTDKAKAAKLQTLNEMSGHVDKYETEFSHTFGVHQHLQKAKNILAHSLSNAKYPFEHSILNKSTQTYKTAKPEGHVAVINNRPTKIVDREEFSKANFEART